jgi:predicted HicB family RNase H-like nuclease
MSDHLEYKGYVGSVDLDARDAILHGRLVGIRDLVTYEAPDAAGLMRAFRDAVDDYLSDCAEDGRAPDKPFKGRFNVRVDPGTHRALALIAGQRRSNLNAIASEALEAYARAHFSGAARVETKEAAAG